MPWEDLKAVFRPETVRMGVLKRDPERCEHGKIATCVDACPSGNEIRDFIAVLADADELEMPVEQSLAEAWQIYTQTSPFPAVCGRICPHTCEDACYRKELEGAVSINSIERAIGDYGIDNNLKLTTLTDERRPENIAVVGSGPGGLSCAYQLARRGYSVTVYEAADKPGGMLRWGIPRYRLPAEILDAEIGKILDLGVELVCSTKVGKDVSFDELRNRYQAVYVGIGAQRGIELGLEGEDADNVLTGVDFLNRINRGERVDVGDNVIVVGGGDAAIDAARVCKRLGAQTTILYRRSVEEMPAIAEEVEEARREGAKLEYLAAPIEFMKEGNRVIRVKCIRMSLGDLDDSGRRRPVPTAGSEFEIPATAVIAAISQEPDMAGFEALAEGGWIQVAENGMTRIEGTYAGGDVIALSVAAEAIGQGRRAAEAIDRKLRGLQPEPEAETPVVKIDMWRRKDYYERYEKVERVMRRSLAVADRLANMRAEVVLPIARAEALEESSRCMSCGDCGLCIQNCPFACWEMTERGPAQKEVYACFSCYNCMVACPNDAISIVDSYHVDDGVFRSDPYPLPARMPLEPRDAAGNPDEWNAIERIVLRRRSVRNFKKKPVPEHLIRRILEAGRFAPSAGNSQPWKFTVITDKALIDEINEAAFNALSMTYHAYKDDDLVQKVLGPRYEANPNPAGYDPRIVLGGMGSIANRVAPVLLRNTPVVILIAGDTRAISGPQLNIGICGQNMTIVANSLGLGACWVGFVAVINGVPSLREKLGLKEPWRIITSLCIGYPKFRQEGIVPRELRPITWLREGAEGPEIEE